MVNATITGRTSLFAVPPHQVEMRGDTFDAAYLAKTALPGPLSVLASAPVLQCLECGGEFSALDLYRESPVAGECAACAAITQRELLSA